MKQVPIILVACCFLFATGCDSFAMKADCKDGIKTKLKNPQSVNFDYEGTGVFIKESPYYGGKWMKYTVEAKTGRGGSFTQDWTCVFNTEGEFDFVLAL